MAIEFHCEHCGKKVRTKDEAAGKRGRCPYCKQSVYIPMPQAEIEPLDLAPLDESDEKKRDSLHKETTKLTGSILRDTKAPPEVSAVLVVLHGEVSGHGVHSAGEPEDSPVSRIP